jgi:hypothetical protein
MVFGCVFGLATGLSGFICSPIERLAKPFDGLLRERTRHIDPEVIDCWPDIVRNRERKQVGKLARTAGNER